MATEDERKRQILNNLKNKRWETYKTWGKCYCSALTSEIHFTPDGFYHLYTDPSGRVRNVAEQLAKFTQLIHAPDVIKNTPKFLTYKKCFLLWEEVEKRTANL